MAILKRTARAEDDLIEIWLYIARDNPKAADTLLERIDQICKRLAERPSLAPARPDLAPELRSATAGRYLVPYREVLGGIEVVRVVHGGPISPRFIAIRGNNTDPRRDRHSRSHQSKPLYDNEVSVFSAHCKQEKWIAAQGLATTALGTVCHYQRRLV